MDFKHLIKAYHGYEEDFGRVLQILYYYPNYFDYGNVLEYCNNLDFNIFYWKLAKPNSMINEVTLCRHLLFKTLISEHFSELMLLFLSSSPSFGHNLNCLDTRYELYNKYIIPITNKSEIKEYLDSNLPILVDGNIIYGYNNNNYYTIRNNQFESIQYDNTKQYYKVDKQFITSIDIMDCYKEYLNMYDMFIHNKLLYLISSTTYGQYLYQSHIEFYEQINKHMDMTLIQSKMEYLTHGICD